MMKIPVTVSLAIATGKMPRMDDLWGLNTVQTDNTRRVSLDIVAGKAERGERMYPGLRREPLLKSSHWSSVLVKEGAEVGLRAGARTILLPRWGARVRLFVHWVPKNGVGVMSGSKQGGDLTEKDLFRLRKKDQGNIRKKKLVKFQGRSMVEVTTNSEFQQVRRTCLETISIFPKA